MKFRHLEGYPKIKDFIAVDFETAMDLHPCQIGMAIVKGGIIVKTISRLIRPPFNQYSPFTIHIHNISPDQTESHPEFPEIWNDIKQYFDGAVVVAHNANFDMNVLSNALETYNLPYPEIKGYICTCDLNNREGLELACARYGICLDHHHDGEDDAINCAKLYLAYVHDECKLTNEELPQELFENRSKNISFEGHDALNGEVLQKDLSDADPTNPFYDRIVVITGLFSIERKELAKKLKSMGADINVGVSSKTNYLLIGQDPGPSKLKKIDELIAAGKDIRKIYQEDLDLIFSGDGFDKYHTEVSKPQKKIVAVKGKKTTWPQLVEKFKHYVNGDIIEFSESEIQSEDYNLLRAYYKQQQKIPVAKSTVLENLRQLNETDEYEFRKDILACFIEGEDISIEVAYERMQNVFSKYGLHFKAKKCVLTEYGVDYEEYKVKGIHHITIKHLPQS